MKVLLIAFYGKYNASNMLINIIDSNDGVVLIDGKHIKSASAVYGQSQKGDGGYQVYLQIILIQLILFQI